MDQERKQSVVIVIKIWNKNCKTTLYTDVIDLVLFLSKCQFVTNNEVAVTKSWKISPTLSLLVLCTNLNQKGVKIITSNSSWCSSPPSVNKFLDQFIKKKRILTTKVYWHFFVQNYPLAVSTSVQKFENLRKAERRMLKKENEKYVRWAALWCP